MSILMIKYYLFSCSLYFIILYKVEQIKKDAIRHIDNNKITEEDTQRLARVQSEANSPP